MRTTTLTLSLLSALSLAACGGGGGSSGPVDAGITPVTNGASLALSADNYEASGVEALGAGLQVGTVMLKTWTTVFELQARLANTALSVVESCSGGGTRTSTVTEGGTTGSVDVGDRLTFLYRDCVLGTGTSAIKQNGSLSITVNTPLIGTVSSASTSFDADVTLSFVSFQETRTDNSDTALAQGTLRVKRTRSASTEVVVINTTGGDKGFIRTATTGGVSNSRTFANYESTITFDTSTIGTSVKGTLTSTTLGGMSLTLSTPVVLSVPNGATTPSKGSFVASGAGTGSVTVAAGGTGLRAIIKLDQNGDGAFENTIERDWTNIN